MKNKILFSILLLVAFSCNRTEDNIDFCTDCDLKTDLLRIEKDKDGWLKYDDSFKQFIIEVAHYNDPIVYVPCEFPSYLDGHNMLAVKFSGTVTCDPLTIGDQIKTTMYCIKLDTIYVPL